MASPEHEVIEVKKAVKKAKSRSNALSYIWQTMTDQALDRHAVIDSFREEVFLGIWEDSLVPPLLIKRN